MKPLVSIIVTTKNEEKILSKLLRSLLAQNYKKTEIIVVDNYSTDNTPQIATRFKNNFFQHGPERSAQRNFGANKSKGEYLLFLDADMELTPNVVVDCINIVDKQKVKAVVIAEESIAENFWGEVKAFERSFYNEHGDPITDAARFFERKTFFKLGGYDEAITGPEDWDLPDRLRKAGNKIGRSSQKIYHHEQRLSLWDLFKKKFYYGVNAHKYLVKHNIPLVSPKTIYFLRPLFYKNWRKLFSNPILGLAMSYMLLVELLGGGFGYLVGRLKK